MGGIKKIDGINIGKNLEKGGQKKSVEKTWKKINSTVVGKKTKRKKLKKANVQNLQIGIPLVTHLINWIIDLFNRDRTE